MDKKYNFTNATWCAMPWSSIQISTSGNYKICCFAGHGFGRDWEGNVVHVLTHTMKEALNSTLHRQVRRSQAFNQRDPQCETCWTKEFAHARQIKEGHYAKEGEYGVSYRIDRTYDHMAKLDGVVQMQDAPLLMKPDGSIDVQPVFLDIRFSNLCNAKCIQCSPDDSSLWYSDYVQLYGTDKFQVGPVEYTIKQEGNKYVSDMPKWHDSPIWWNQFDEIKHHLRHIYVTGGEPFVQPSHDEMLDRFIAADLAKDIVLDYDTNLQQVNTKLLERLKHFKEVRFAVSLDDTEKRYELIRFPSSWKKLLENLEKIKDLPNLPTPRISMCIGFFSPFAQSRVIPFFSARGYTRFPIRLIRKPSVFKLEWYPTALKKQIIEKYDTIDIHPRWKGATLGYLKNTLNSHTDDECLKMIKGFIMRMDGLDRLRGTDWKDTFPEVAEMLRSHYGDSLPEV
jgi:organic radical activating enzyme